MIRWVVMEVDGRSVVIAKIVLRDGEIIFIERTEEVGPFKDRWIEFVQFMKCLNTWRLEMRFRKRISLKIVKGDPRGNKRRRMGE